MQVILAIMIVFTTGIEENDNYDNFKWLPLGKYESFKYRDYIFMQKLEKDDPFFHGISKELIRNSILSSFPEEMVSALVYIFAAKTFKNKVLLNEQDEKPHRLIAGKHIIASGERLYVVQIEDHKTGIDAAMKKGLLSDSGNVYLDQTIYQFRSKKDKKAFHLFPTSTGKLLICEDIDMLKSMADSGFGKALSFMDDPDFGFYEEIFEELGPTWEVRFSKWDFMIQRELAIKYEYPQERRDHYNNMFENGVQIWGISRLVEDNNVYSLRLELYGNEDVAESEVNRKPRDLLTRTPLNETQSKIYNKEKQNTTKYREGRLVVTKKLWDEEYKRIRTEAWEALQKERKEKAEQEKKESRK